jgi:hypothetical protein
LGIEATLEAIASRRSIDLGALSAEIDVEESIIGAFTHGRRFGGQVKEVLDHLASRRALHETTIVVSRQAPRLAELWAEVDSPKPVLDSLPDTLNAGEIHIIQGALSEGWAFKSSH